MANFFSKLFKKQSAEEEAESVEKNRILETLDNEELTDEEIEQILEDEAAATEAEDDYFDDEDEEDEDALVKSQSEESVVEEKIEIKVKEIGTLDVSGVLKKKTESELNQLPENVETVATENTRKADEEDVIADEATEEDETTEENFFQKLKAGLFKTRNNITDRINAVVANFRVIDEEFFDELEEILITSDVGVETSMRILEDLREQVKLRNLKSTEDIISLLKEELQKILGFERHPIGVHTPEIVLIIGVNGVGKTTSIGKIASRLKKSGKRVLIAAADTFRAGAIEQLQVWGKRSNVDVISHQEGADPAAVIYDAISAAKSRKTDVLICDTAGRLHNKKNLMDELKKINKVIDRDYPEAHRETLLVLDATTGQNAVAQAKVFQEVADITGIILTKLDGTAKGGIVIAIANELKIPVRFIGVGEKISDLQDFDPKDFVEALFGN